MTTLAEPVVLARARFLTRPYVRAVAAYLAVRAFGVLVLALFADTTEHSLLDRLTAWDGQWYLAIADDGYGGITKGLVDAEGKLAPHTPLAFFPLYPLLLRVVAALTGTSTVFAGLLVSVLAGVAAACALFRLGRMAGGNPRVGLLLVVLWAGAPMAITLSMVYTEALFTAFAAWALVGVVERRWLLAALCCIGAGLTRPSAAVLIGVVALAAVVVFLRSQDKWQPLACAVVCPSGLLGYWAWVADRTGDIRGWFNLEWDGWRTKFDAGAESAEFIWDKLVTGASVMETLTVFILLLAAVSAALLPFVLRSRPGRWPLALFGIGMVILVAGTAGLPFAKTRFLLPGFVLLLPLAIGLANRRPATAIAGAAAFVLVGSWFSAYSLTGWHYAI
ncbi:hypothetical protein LWC34_46370 [Kibdelosporangium philippinense]|uniref:Dolichyl-phosphate-mannose-protein mannosyltransferase n=1 Tax=Kibdelosporangium philippinense TaxID=211113 RepID=A0ABS8ZU90_9PSEU|nr:hypothetical protein [Kibdelosporangium philippinense]MCE7010181.1 hypothetical protein [Kibdelosporangium philippinense]